MINKENKIYLLQVQEKNRNGIPLTKVGDTYRDVEERNNETITNASLHRINDITYWSARKSNGTMFRDKSLHKFLEKKGYERELNQNGNKSEWFYDLSEEVFNALFEEFIGGKTSKQYTLRPGQEFIFNQVKEAWDNDYRYYNLDACVRVGKSILSLHIAKTFDMFPCYIGKNLTSQKSVQKDNSEFNIVDNILTQSIHGEVIDEETEDINDEDITSKNESSKVNKILENIKEANAKDKKIIFFVDEVDDSSHTNKSRDIIKKVTEKIKKLNKFGGFITMSGTRSYRGLKVLNDLEPKKIKEINLAYYEMQKLQPEFTCKRNFKNISFFSEKSELLSISDSLKSATGRKSLAETLKTLLSENSYDIRINPDFPNYFVKFATIGKSNANSLVKLMNRSFTKIQNKEYMYFNINGDTTNSKEAEEFCELNIKENPDKICIFVTQGMATTSFSVKSIGTSMVFSDNPITSDDVQSLHRSCTWSKRKNEANLIYITTTDSLELKFDDIFESEALTTNKDDKNQIYKEILERNCITHYMVGNDSVIPCEVNNENIELVLDKKLKQITKVSNIVRLMFEDSESIIEILENTSIKTKNGSSKKSGTGKGKNIDIFGSGTKSPKKGDKSSKMTQSKMQKIFREIAERIILVPVMSRIHGVKLGEEIGWEKLGISTDIYSSLITTIPLLKERMESIYNLCSEDDYLEDNYMDLYLSLSSILDITKYA